MSRKILPIDSMELVDSEEGEAWRDAYWTNYKSTYFLYYFEYL